MTNSGSDSDTSHISSTPPRHHHHHHHHNATSASSPSPHHTLLLSHKQRLQNPNSKPHNNKSSSSRPVIKIKPNKKKPKTRPDPVDAKPDGHSVDRSSFDGKRSDPVSKRSDPVDVKPDGHSVDRSSFVGKRSDPGITRVDPVGRCKSGCDLLGSDPVSKRSDPDGKRSDPVSKRSDPDGKRSDPVSKRSDPDGKRSDPLGRGPDPVSKRSDPGGRGKSGFDVTGSDPVPNRPDPDDKLGFRIHKPLGSDSVDVKGLDTVDVKLPFSICRLSGGCDNVVGTSDSAVGGSGVGRFASFAKLRKPSLNFESNDVGKVETTSLDGGNVIGANESVSSVRKHPNLIGENLLDFGSGNETLSRNLGKAVRKPQNLIGGSVMPNVPVSKPKVVSEGNFVRLNINGHGGRKKFGGNKVRKRNPNAYNGSKKSYKRSKRKLKSGVEEGDEERTLCEEESLRFEENEVKEKKRADLEVVEQVVLDVRNDPCDENLVKLLKLTHGYESFRDGQLEAIKLILDGKSSMVILPTGAGKSLCYQLPALVLQGMTLVISPLVALMFDQLKQLPPVIPGGLLCSSQTLEESSETLRRVHEGSLKVLYVSPERLLNAEFTSIFSATSLISLVVIDEAHCISEWSHNFRPSYMRLRASLLRATLGVECILAMTATATTKTMNDVMCSLKIPPTNLVQTAQVRDNLQLSVSMSGNRMKDVMALIKVSPYTEVKSIIIYCKYQSETEMISKFLCDSNIRSKCYHGGIPAKDRRRTQEQFCSNKIRVIVATVAFGMGLDKSDVGAVIHYGLPGSLEEYVQEIGRAGRDGRLSYCHLFIDDTTYFKLRSLMYSDGLDQYTVNKFLSEVFTGGSHSQGKICSIVKESASRKFDMKEEVILTLLTRLELAEEQYLRLLPQTSVTCVLNFHMTSPALLAAKDVVIAAILKKSELKDGQYVFDIPTVACSIGLQTSTVSQQLQLLKLKGEITYELKDPSYCYMILNFPKDVCSLASDLAKWLSEVESCKVRKLDAMYNAALFAVKTCDRTSGCIDSQHTPCLQKKILDYFNADNDNDIPNKMGQTSRFLRADIKVFLQGNSHAKFTPRAIARIMHGIASPAFPSSTWSKTHFWGRYIQTNFDVIMEAAQAEMIASAGKSAV